MAYLGNTLINGSLRCLNKAYFNDLSIGNDVEIAGKTTTNQLVISSDYNPSNLASANSSTAAIPLVIGNPTGVHIAMDADEIQFKNNATSNRAGYINYSGGRIYLSNGTKIYADNGVFKADSLGTSDSRIPNAYITTLDATTSNIATLNASTGTVQDLEVKNVLKSFKWDISNVANLANDFMIAPTIEIATDGKVSVSKSGSDYIFTFADSNTITSDEFAGCKWLDGSKVRFTTKINDKLFSDVYGTVTGNMNTTSGRLAVKTSLTEDDLTGVSMNTPYDAVGSTIMLYAITKTGDANIYPVGIHMTAYGTNNSYYIDMYGGNSPSSSGTKAQPVFRIGNLKGITYNGQTFQEAKWGVYTYNGYFEGAVVAKEGKIGEWTIDAKKIYTGTWGTANSAMMSPGTTSTDGNKSIGGSNSISGWTFTSGANFGVNKDGSLYANKGKIGDWVIETDRLHIGDFGGSTSVVLSTGITSTTDIGGSGTRTSQNALTWVFTAGNKFGVTNNGVLYASDVNVTGTVNATALHVGSSTSANHLIYENSTIDLQTDWLKFDDGVVTIGQDNNSQIFLDGQSIDLKDENSLTYFYVGDKRINGVYTFTMEHPYIVTNNYDSNSIGVNYVINSNYPVTVFDEENNEIPIDRIYSLQIVSDSYEFLAGKVYKILFTTSDPVYNFSYVQKPDFIGSNAVVFAKRGKSYGANSFTEGIDTTASGRASHAEGEDTTASGSLSHAEGGDTTASGNYGSHAEGNSTIASGNWGSHAEGNNTTASSLSSHAEGDGTTASGWYSHAEGDDTTASGNYGSHAEGNGTVASSDSSHAEGYHTTASGGHSHAEGMYTTASGNYGSHAEGCNTVASGYISHAEGDDTTASGRGSHSSGRYSVASGEYSHAQGISTEASGRASYAEGNSSMASGNWSHAEGYFTSSQGSASHAEGGYSVATGVYSHAQGRYSKALEECSCAIGRSTTASGKGSFASGDSTYATRDYQTAIGKYNATTKVYSDVLCSDSLVCSNDLIVDGTTYTHDAGDYAFIIGNGESDSKRSNAFTVNWNGNIRSCHPSVSTTTAPSSDTWIQHYNLNDSTGYSYGKVQGDFLANGEIGVTLQANRTINDTYYQNHLSLHIKNDGTPVVTVGHPEKWRIALGVNIKTLSQNITTDAYGQCSVPSSLTSKTILGVRTGNYQYGAFLIGSTNIRVFKISAIPLDWAKSVSVPLIFTYVD